MKNLKSILCVILMSLLLCFAYFCITGCSRTVKNNVVTHDTLIEVHTLHDTLNVQQASRDSLHTAKTDTVYSWHVYHDSIEVRDSVYVKEKGDSVYIYKEKWRTRVDIRHDTIYKAKTDTVYKVRTDTVVVYRSSERDDSAYIAKEQSKEVVKQKKDWKSRLFIGLLGFAVIGTIVWWIRKWARGQ